MVPFWVVRLTFGGERRYGGFQLILVEAGKGRMFSLDIGPLVLRSVLGTDLAALWIEPNRGRLWHKKKTAL